MQYTYINFLNWCNSSVFIFTEYLLLQVGVPKIEIWLKYSLDKNCQKQIVVPQI